MTTTATTKTRTRAIKRTGKHNWLEKEYMVAIYMALHSKENKVGMYSIDQCAFLIGVSSNAMKMMADNFRAFLGETNLGTHSPRMKEAIVKYKTYPEEKLRKVAVDYLDKTWNNSRRLLDVKRYVNSIGTGAFVDYYEVFKKASLDSDNLKEYTKDLSDKWSQVGKMYRLNYANVIFKCILEKEALEIITKSQKITKSNRGAIEKANMLLSKHFPDAQ